MVNEETKNDLNPVATAEQPEVSEEESSPEETDKGHSTNSDGRPKLVFDKYGNAYFLAAAWLPNSDHGREFFASASEIQVARNGGQDVIELALLAKK